MLLAGQAHLNGLKAMKYHCPLAQSALFVDKNGVHV
jgi:hypothetical protein